MDVNKRVGFHDPEYQSGYLTNMLEIHRLEKTAELAEPVLEKHLPFFQAFAFRGMSGALIAPILALAFKKTLILVRKPEDKNHDSAPSVSNPIGAPHVLVRGDKAARTYIIVDDLISTGVTVRWIHAHIKDWNPHARCLGALLVNRLHEDADCKTRGGGNVWNVYPFPGSSFVPSEILESMYLISTPPDCPE